MADGREIWTPDISFSNGPRYLALVSAIADAIDNGELPPGARLPTQRSLANRLGVTVGTVGRAYKISKKRGLISGEVGRGTFVRETVDRRTADNFLPERKHGTIDLACFRLPVETLSNILAQAIAAMAHHAATMRFSTYPPPEGHTSTRAAGAAWIERSGAVTSPDRVIACGGGQQGLLIAVMGLAEPTGIITEAVTYSGLKSIAALRGIELFGVAMDDEGIVPEALDAEYHRTGAGLVYLQPTIHNPLGSSMSEHRRRQIAKLAQRRDLIIIEDDVAAAGMIDRPPPIAAFAPERTIYLTSLSKCISPALRVAYMAVPEKTFDRLTATTHALSLGAPPIVFDVASKLIENGSADEIARMNSEELSRRHALAARSLSGLELQHHPEAFFAWLRLPVQWTPHGFATALERTGVSVVPVDNFRVAAGEQANGVRFSLNPHRNKAQLVEGFARIADLITKPPIPHSPIV